MNDGVISVAGHVNDSHIAPQRYQLFSQLATAHLRHHHISQHQVYHSEMLPCQDQGLSSVSCHKYLVSTFAKYFCGHLSD